MSMTGLTAAEQDLIHASRRALDRYDRARASGDGAALIKARRKLELVRSELEALKAGDPLTTALSLCRKALERPIDAVTGLPIDRIAKAKAVTTDRFDKLVRHGALAK